MCSQMIPEPHFNGVQALMPRQGSAAQADGPPHGSTSGCPSMADRRGGEAGQSQEFRLSERKGGGEIRGIGAYKE